jgi:hypothetical protein
MQAAKEDLGNGSSSLRAVCRVAPGRQALVHMKAKQCSALWQQQQQQQQQQTFSFSFSFQHSDVKAANSNPVANGIISVSTHYHHFQHLSYQ